MCGARCANLTAYFHYLQLRVNFTLFSKLMACCSVFYMYCPVLALQILYVFQRRTPENGLLFLKSTFCCHISIHNALCVSKSCTAILHDWYWKCYKPIWVNFGEGRNRNFPLSNIARRYKSAPTEYTQILKHNSQSTASPKFWVTEGFMTNRSFMHHLISCKNLIRFLTAVFCSQD